MILKELKEAALKHNGNKGCGMADDAETIKDWVSLVFNEAKHHCLKYKFPTMDIWDKLDKEFDMSQYGIFINKGKCNVEFPKQKRIIIIGNIDATILCDELRAYKIILMQGAKCTIKATNYAVVFVDEDGTTETKEEVTNGAIVNYSCI